MMTPLFTGGLTALPEHLYSHGSAIMATLQQVAGAAGTAGFVTLAAIGSTSDTGTPDADGLHLAFMVAGVIGLIAVGVSFLTRAKPSTPDDATTTTDGATADAATAVGDAPASGAQVDDRSARTART
jgi:DHA2 family lincomycin resistance protein-like MFS transporter